jgi:hypothetical protein
MDSLNDIRKIITFFSVLILIAISAIIGLSLHAHSSALATISVIWSLACLASGAAVGFLFGIPKILQTDSTLRADTAYRQQPNTNLEQISDWLTKIIVGLGLYEIRSIPPFVYRMAETLSRGIGSGEDNIAFALALITYSLAVGFLFGYLVTRVFLAPVFARADLGTAIQQAKKEMANEEFDSVLAGQVLLKTEPKDFIKGQDSFEDERDAESDQGTAEKADDTIDNDPDEPAKLTQELAELKRKDKQDHE